MRTRTVGGTDSARRLVFVLERNVLERVHLAEVGTARFQRCPDLGVGQLRAALGARLLDDRVDGPGLVEVAHQSCSLVSTCVTGSPVERCAFDGRSTFIHFDTRSGSVEMMISSNLLKLAASCTAAPGSVSPTLPSTLKPAARIFSSAASRCGTVCSRAASGSAAFSSAPPPAGTTNTYSCSVPLLFMASRSSEDSAVLFATTSIRAMRRTLVRRQIRVPLALLLSDASGSGFHGSGFQVRSRAVRR